MVKRKRKTKFTKPAKRRVSSSRKIAQREPSSTGQPRLNTDRTQSSLRDDEDAQSDSHPSSEDERHDDNIGEQNRPDLVDEEREDEEEDALNDDGEREDHEEHVDESGDSDDHGLQPLGPRLVAGTIWIRRQTIDKKWDHLDLASQRAVRNILADVARPVVASRLGDRMGKDAQDAEGKSAEAQVAVEKVVDALTRKLHRVPVPPHSSADAFDYEMMIRDTAAAEGQLSEQMAGIATLRAGIKFHESKAQQSSAEVTSLQNEIEELRAAHEKRIQSRYAKLLRMPSGEPEDSARRIRLAPRPKGRNVFDTDVDLDPEVARLMDQLNHHIGSIRANRFQLGNFEQELDHAMANERSLVSTNGI